MLTEKGRPMKKKIYITIDTECHDIERPDRYIWGKAQDGKYYGIKKILELGKELDVPLNFFVDIAECKRYGVDFVKSIVDLIASYHQPVFIHLHPNYISGDDTKTYMWQYSQDEQEQIFKETLAYYEELLPDFECKFFRIGRYGANSDMYKTLEKSMGKGVVDFSYCAYNSKMCHLDEKLIGSDNRIVQYGNTIIFPNTRYRCFRLGKISKYLNLDTAESTFGEFKEILMQNRLPFITLTMHSWNFIKKYFFIDDKIWGDHSNIKKFYKMISFAKDNGYEFGNLRCDYKELVCASYDDQTLDLCHTKKSCLKGYYRNFIRFQNTARLTKKYFLVYCFIYFVAVFLLSLLLIIAL